MVVTDRKARTSGEAEPDHSMSDTQLRALWLTQSTAQILTTPWFQSTARIGSGDAFTAALLADQSLESALAAASLANQSAGDFPTLTELELACRRQEFFGT